MGQKRVMVIANKWWEADPLCWILLHDKARPNVLTDFACKHYPTQRPAGPPQVTPRLTFQCGEARVEVWCVEELMNPSVNSSNTAEKARVLPAAMAWGEPPDLVVAFGTAGSREGLNANGSVVVGRRVFLHDPYSADADRAGKWTPPRPETVIDSALPTDVFKKIPTERKQAAEARFLAPPVAPASPMLVLAGNGFVSLGIVNVTNWDDYAWTDKSGVEAFNRHASRLGQIGSIESTHGLIREMSDAPFLYVSGITDTVGLFDAQVTPREYSQNTAAAHNAALTIAWLLPSLIEL